MNAEQQKLTQWVQGLQPGDEVMASRRTTGGFSRRGPGVIQKVAKVTPTQVVLVDGRRYDRATGRLRETGAHGEIQPITQADRDSIEHAAMQNWLISLVPGPGAWDRKQPLHVLRAMKAAYEKATKDAS